MRILRFKPPIDAFGYIDVVKLDEEFAARDGDYDPLNCKYQGSPKTMAEYVELKYGQTALALIEHL